MSHSFSSLQGNENYGGGGDSRSGSPLKGTEYFNAVKNNHNAIQIEGGLTGKEVFTPHSQMGDHRQTLLTPSYLKGKHLADMEPYEAPEYAPAQRQVISAHCSDCKGAKRMNNMLVIALLLSIVFCSKK